MAQYDIAPHLEMATGRAGLSIPVPALASMHPPRPQTILEVKIEHLTPPSMETVSQPCPHPHPQKLYFFYKIF